MEFADIATYATLAYGCGVVLFLADAVRRHRKATRVSALAERVLAYTGAA